MKNVVHSLFKMLNLLDLYTKVITISKDTLKDHLINYFNEIGDIETAQTIINKGLPNALHFYGEKTTCYKNEIIFIQQSQKVPKGKIEIIYHELPKLQSGCISPTSNQLIEDLNFMPNIPYKSIIDQIKDKK